MHRPNPSMPKSKRSEQHPEASETLISFFSDYQKYTLKSFPPRIPLDPVPLDVIKYKSVEL